MENAWTKSVYAMMKWTTSEFTVNLQNHAKKSDVSDFPLAYT